MHKTGSMIFGPASLEQALIEFSEKARLSINYSGLDISELETKGTGGSLSKRAALRAILSGTGLEFRFLTQNSVQIFKPEQKKAEGPFKIVQSRRGRRTS